MGHVVQALTCSPNYRLPFAVTKRILVAQGQPLQAQLWKLVLESQRHTVLLIPPQRDLLEVATAQPLDLMVVDMTTGLFNPYDFCRNCRDRLPNTPVILTHYPRRPIEPAERRWAIYQGAAEVIPGLAEASDIFDSLERIYKAAQWSFPIDAEALSATLSQMGLMARDPSSPASPPQPTGENSSSQAAPPETKPSAPQPKYRLMYRGQPIDGAGGRQ